MLLHQIIELTSLIREFVKNLLNVWEADLTSRYHIVDLIRCNTIHLCQLLHKRNASTSELPYIRSIQATLNHRSTIQVHNIIKRQRQTRGYVTQSHQGIIYLISTLTVCQELFSTVSNTIQIKRCLSGCFLHLLHQFMCLALGTQHSFKSDLQLLELTSYLYDRRKQVRHALTYQVRSNIGSTILSKG